MPVASVSNGKTDRILKLGVSAARFLLPHSVACFCLTYTSGAAAYVGPGAGITMLGALAAVVAAVAFAFLGLFLWPIRALRRRKKKAETDALDTSDAARKEESGGA